MALNPTGTNQWSDPNYTAGLPVWKQWPSGGWGYADPVQLPPAGSNNPIPGSSGSTVSDEQIRAAQEKNWAAQQPQPAPAPSVTSGGTSTKKAAPAPAPKPASYEPVGFQPQSAAMKAKLAAAGWVQAANGNYYPKGHSILSKPGNAPVVPPGGSSASSSSSEASYSQPAMDALARQKIIELMMTPQDIDQAELDRSPEAAAHRLAQQRAYERNRALLAERNAAEGLAGTGGAESGIMRLQQGRGESEVAFMGGLAGEKLQQNRARLEQGIQFALSQGQFAAAEAMKEKLANLDAAVRREQIKASSATASADRKLQRELGLLDLGYRYDQLGVNANRDAALALMNPNFY